MELKIGDILEDYLYNNEYIVIEILSLHNMDTYVVRLLDSDKTIRLDEYLFCHSTRLRFTFNREKTRKFKIDNLIGGSI